MAPELRGDTIESTYCCMAFDSDALTLDEACFDHPEDLKFTPSVVNIMGSANFSEEEGKSRRRYKRRRGVRRKKITQEEAEWQRMVHIAVERNRRKQVKDHLTVLRCMTPPSYIPRGDQASIIGGTIEFIEDLKKIIHSLQHQKTLRNQDGQKKARSSLLTEPTSSSIANVEVKIENKEGGPTLIIVKALSKKSNHQLFRLLLALERLAVVITHLNITTLQDAIMYSISIQIGKSCSPDLNTANELAASIYGIFKDIHLRNINEISHNI